MGNAKTLLESVKKAVEPMSRDRVMEISHTFTVHPSVVFIVKGCFTLLGRDEFEKQDWHKIREQLKNDRQFFDLLRNFDPDNVKDVVWDKIRTKYLKDSLFDPHKDLTGSPVIKSIA